MRAPSLLRHVIAATAFGGLALFALSAAPEADGQANFVQDGKAGFVVSSISYALSQDANETGACPAGMTTGVRDAYAATAEGARRDGESDQDYTRRLNQGARALMTAANGQNLCMNPEAGAPDPNWRTVTARNIPAHGIDLDGQTSTANGRAAPGTCAHEDFRGFNGERGVDNQFFRAVGCVNAYQSTGQANSFTGGMLVGEWGILFTLSGVDDIRNDNSVEVGIYANADPIQLSPNREPLPNATYAMTQNPAYRATARGRIVNGVLTTEPTDIRLYRVTNAIFLDRPLRDARLRVTLGADGAMEGILAGYTPVEEMYDLQFGYRSGRTSTGTPSPLQLRVGSSNGNANVNNFTCNGAYHALLQLADGHRDAQTGRCTSISTQYQIRAIPAFVVDQATSSTNSDLEAASTFNSDRGYRAGAAAAAGANAPATGSANPPVN